MKKKISSLSRWLHIYLSMASFFLLFFFAFTGITLNHTEWFADQQQTKTFKGSVQKEWVNSPDTLKVARLEIVELLRSTHKIEGKLDEFVMDPYQCRLSFKGPGYAADVFIERENGQYELTETKTGAIGILNDLHKGRDSGGVWKVLIDVSSILMILVSFTGLMMLFFLKKKRMAGVLTAIIGLILTYLIYLIWVP